MIKKYFVLVFLLMIALVVSSNTTYAVTFGDITWADYNAYSTYHFAVGTAEVPYNTGEIQVQIPYSDYHEFTYGGLEASIRFFEQDDLVTPVKIIYLFDVHPASVEGLYTFDLISESIVGIVEIEIWIPQNYSSVPGGYLGDGGYLDQNDLILMVPIAPYDIPVFWNNINVYSTYYAIVSEIEVPFNASSLQIYIPESAYHRLSYGGVDSNITLYDSADVLLETVLMSELATKPDGLMLIDFTSYDLNEVATIEIRIMQNYTTMPSGYTDYMTEFTSITFNEDVKLAIYIMDNEEYNRQLFTTLPPYLEVSKEGYTFEGWFFKNGMEYDFSSTISDTYIEFNSTVMLYAKFTITDPIPVFEEGTPANAFNNFLAIFHLNNLLGYLLSYFIVNIGIVLGLKALNLSGTIMSIGMIAVTGIFIYVGVLPLLMIIIGLGIDFASLIINLGRGD